MRVPFTVEEFLAVFETYNLAVWPAQIIAYMLGLTAIFLVARNLRGGNKAVASVLSLMWLWNGGIYHIIFFASINKAAYFFGALFVLQGIVFFWRGVLKDELTFGFARGVYAITGSIFVLYSLFVYPALGAMSGHGWPQSPVFGLAPCPTTIFTFGLLLLSQRRFSKYILAVPLLWSFVGLSAAVNFRIYEDFGLLIAGLTGTAMLLIRDKKSKARPAATA